MSQDEYTRALDAKFAVAYALGWLGDDCGDDEVVVRLRNVSAYLESVLSGLRAEPKPEEKPCESCAALEEANARLREALNRSVPGANKAPRQWLLFRQTAEWWWRCSRCGGEMSTGPYTAPGETCDLCSGHKP